MKISLVSYLEKGHSIPQKKHNIQMSRSQTNPKNVHSTISEGSQSFRFQFPINTWHRNGIGSW